jgi:hypothetical protein
LEVLRRPHAAKSERWLLTRVDRVSVRNPAPVTSIALDLRARYDGHMETPEEIRVRWRYLRDLLIEQLGRFESGAIHLHEAGVNVSTDAIWILKQNIQEFDTLTSESVARDL